MIIDTHQELSRAQLKKAYALARTMVETADELTKLCNRRHPELNSLKFLLSQSHKAITKTCEDVGIDL